MPHKKPEIDNDSQNLNITDEYRAWIIALRKYSVLQRYRAVVTISGPQNDSLQLARDFINVAGLEKTICLSDSITGALKLKQATTQLGKEYESIVFDMYSGFDPDALGAICGTLTGGGILFLIIPYLKDWNEYDSGRFLKRIVPILRGGASVYWIEETKVLPELKCKEPVKLKSAVVDEPFRTDEQKIVVEAIEKMALADMHAPVVLTSDRGRGKSAALGLSAGRLLQKGMKRIVVTAPRMSIAEPVFRHAKQVCEEAVIHPGRLKYLDGELIFIAPDALLDGTHQLDILLVDEAASIPLSMLESLLNKYPSIVFSTTVHGYEGTGRGFVLKFDKVLDRLTPGWQLFTMNTPVRWAEGDPVEAWLDHLLCLDAELSDVSDLNTVEKSKCYVVLQDRDVLVTDNNYLSSIFSLLVHAHYRTRPSDLSYMLDTPGVRIYTLEYRQRVLAAILINEEGGFDAELSHLIYQGERRPGGHLLAQTLSLHAGCELAATLKYSRIMRIAVHPKLQAQGLGSLFLEQVVIKEKSQQIDAIGTSFGASIDLLRFWERAGFSMVRLGFTRDHASGTHSAVMLMPVTSLGNKVYRNVQSRFQRYLPGWIDEIYGNIPDDMLAYLDKIKQIDNMELTEDDWKDAASFAQSHRGYESCMWALKKLVHQYPVVISGLSNEQQNIINARIKRRLGWPDTVDTIGASGKAEAVMQLRQAIRSLLDGIEKK